MAFRVKTLLLALVLVGISVPAPAAPLTSADRETVARAEAALNGMRRIEARFVQSSSIGGFAEGTIYVARPGNLRIDYAPPTPLQVYGDHTWLIYLDFELKEASQLPISATPAAFLVQDQLKLSGDLLVTGVDRRTNHLSLDIVRAEEPDAGTLRIVMDPSASTLRGWVVIDPQGVQTRIMLIKPVFNRPIDEKVFLYSPPSWALAPPETTD